MSNEAEFQAFFEETITPGSRVHRAMQRVLKRIEVGIEANAERPLPESTLTAFRAIAAALTEIEAATIVIETDLGPAS